MGFINHILVTHLYESQIEIRYNHKDLPDDQFSKATGLEGSWASMIASIVNSKARSRRPLSGIFQESRIESQVHTTVHDLTGMSSQHPAAEGTSPTNSCEGKLCIFTCTHIHMYAYTHVCVCVCSVV